MHRFQEQLLARRAVYFVAGRIFYRCREDTYAEQCADHSPRGGNPGYEYDDLWSSLLPMVAALDDPLHDFGGMLTYYTARTLTFQSDTLRALAGIIRRVSEKAKCRFLQGIPTVAFDAFLIFESNELGALRRRQGFPSYSWAGWKGRILMAQLGDMFHDLNRWLEEFTWIIWYKRSPSGVLNLIWDPSANESFPFGDLSYPGYRRRWPFRAPPGVNINSTRTYPTEDFDSEPMPKREYPLLQFWTVAACFRIQLEDEIRGRARIMTAQGTPAGHVRLDGMEETSIFTTQDSFEFILLSRVMERHHQELEESEDRYYVMLLEWMGPVAERRGFGLLDMSATTACLPPGPQWKEIVLG